jgi:hypothetical protein
MYFFIKNSPKYQAISGLVLTAINHCTMSKGKQVLKWGTIAFLLMVSGVITYSSTPPTVFFREGFETGGTHLPSGWINVTIVNNDTWRVGQGAGPFPPGQSGLPDVAAVGATNAFFRVPSANPFASRLISPPINLEFAVNPELRFWHAQVPRDGMHARLVVYIATNINGPWTTIASFPNPVTHWVERTILIPGGSRNLFVAFEGHSGQGLGGSVCVDEVSVVETGTMPREVSNIASFQPSTEFVSTGSTRNQVLNTAVKVIGNTGALNLANFTVVSQSTNHNDVAPNGVRLWASNIENFRNAAPIGSPQSLVNGQAVFTGLNLPLATGYTYFWVTFDVASNAQAGNFIDASLPIGGLTINSQNLPLQEQNPAGNRVIAQTVFFDDFETERGWILSGEWQRANAQGLGGHQNGQGETSGPSDPAQAISGTRILGTDITGLGTYPGNYEPNLPEMAYVAVSPEINAFYFSDVTLSFERWLNVHIFHRANIDISTDNGLTWTNLWTNYEVHNTSNWSQVSYSVPWASRKPSVRFRFGLGETGGLNLQSGWNIDDLVVTGTFITTDVGVSQWVTPKSTCSLGANETVTVVVTNYGAATTPSTIPVAFSINNGLTWMRDTLRTAIPVGQSVPFTFGPRANFSAPGNYNIIAKTELQSDQYPDNDVFLTEVFSAPIISIPYAESFETGPNFWRAHGTNASMELAMPMAPVINNAFNGSMAWVTNSFGAYNAGEVSIVESPCFNLTGISSPVLDFNLQVHTPTGLDGAAIDYSLDGGFTWTRLEPRSPALAWFWYNHNNITGLQTATGNGRGWSGNSNGWINPRVVLPVILGNQPSVRFRLIFAAQHVFLGFEGVAMDLFKIYPAPPDVGITAIIEPVTACTLDRNQQISASIRNMGIDTLRTGSIIPVNLMFLNDTVYIRELFTLSANLEPGLSVPYTFIRRVDMSKPGTYNLTAYTSLPGDIGFYTPGVSNDSLTVAVIHHGLPEISLGEDFYTIRPDTVVLDAGPGMIGYLWQNGSTGQTFSVSNLASAWYRATVTDHNNCQSTDSIRIKTYDIGLINVLDPQSGCQNPDGEQVRLELSNLGHDTFPAGLQIPLTLYFEGLKIEDMVWVLNAPLLPSSHTEVQFNTIVNIGPLGNYAFSVRHGLPDANASNDSIHWIASSLGLPHINLGDTIFTTQPDTLLLDAGAGFASYLWQNGHTGQTFGVTSPYTQTYKVTVTDLQGCSDSDDVLVFTYDAAITEITAPTTECLPLSPVPISFVLENLGVDTFQVGKVLEIEWYFDQSAVSREIFQLNSMLLPGESRELSFAQLFRFDTAGTYRLHVEIISRDARITNNSYQHDVELFEVPELQIPPIIITNRPDTVILDAGPGHDSYLWQNGHTGRTLAITDFGNFSVTVGNAFDCFTTGTIRVEAEFPDMGILDIVSAIEGCLDEFAILPVSVNLINSGNVPVPEGAIINLQYSLNGTPQASQELILPDTLLPGVVIPFTFSQNISYNTAREDTLEIRLAFGPDLLPANDSLVSAIRIFAIPEPTLPDTIITANPIGLILNPGPGYHSYLWSGGSTSSTFTIISPFSQWYKVNVTNDRGCSTQDSVFVLTWDVAASSLINPRSNCILSNSEPVTFVFQNRGPDILKAGHRINAGYSINGAAINRQTFILATNLAPMQVRIFTFSQTANLSVTGTYQVRIIIEDPDVDMDNNTIEADVLVPGVPIVNLGRDIYTLRPDTVVLNAGPGFASYLWRDGSTGQRFHVPNHGWYYVIVTDSYGCIASDTISVNPGTSVFPVEDFERNLLVFPNPSIDVVTVQFNNQSMEWNRLELINQTGSMVLSREIETPGIVQEKLNVGNLHPGVYYIRIIGLNAVVTRKLIVKRR